MISGKMILGKNFPNLIPTNYQSLTPLSSRVLAVDQKALSEIGLGDPVTVV